MLVDRRDDALDRGLAAEGARALLDVRRELVVVLVQVARDGIDGEVPESAKRLPEDAVADVEQQVEIGQLGATLFDLRQQLDEPSRPLAARRALAARLVHVEL